MQIRFIVLVAVFPVFTACGGKHFDTLTAPEIKDHAIEPVALVPFMAVPVRKEGFRKETIDPKGAALLTEGLHEGLRAMKVQVILVGETVDTPVPDENLSEFLSSEALELGRRHKTPVVLFGYVSTFTHREGTSVGIKKPASVGFTVHLIETREGRSLWSAEYRETQKSLFEDLTEFWAFFKRRGRWLDADELAAFGLEGVMERSPWSQKIK